MFCGVLQFIKRLELNVKTVKINDREGERDRERMKKNGLNCEENCHQKYIFATFEIELEKIEFKQIDREYLQYMEYEKWKE